MPERLGLRVRFALFFAALALAVAVALVAGLWIGHARAGGPAQGYVIAGLVAGFVLIGATAWVAILFDENVARPMLALASDLRTRARTGIDTEIDAERVRYLGALAPAATAVHRALSQARAEQTHAVAEQTARLNREKAVFETLLRDMAEGVVVATSDHRIMLYNRAAQGLLGDLGLNRPLTAFLRAEPLTHALDRLNARATRGQVEAERFLAATARGRRFLLARVSPVTAEGERVGYVLIFHDATEDLAAHAERDHLFNALLETVRRPTAAIGALFDALEAAPDLASGPRAAFTTALRDELGRLVTGLAEMGERHNAAMTRHWPMPEVASDDIFDGLRARHDGLAGQGHTQFLHCDGFAILEVLSRLIEGLSASATREEFALSALPQGREVWLILDWQGEDAPDGLLDNWLSRPLTHGYGKYSGRDVLEGHGTEIWSEPTRTGHRLVLPLEAADAARLTPTDPRPEFYDFTLPGLSAGSADTRRLSELSFVVFDTETTGLAPRSGDEIVQIAGIRIVNGRLLQGEVFDTLVNPNRRIPAAATAVHGISEAQVQDAPDITEAGRRFHAFCEGAVLVAHNAPFDMAFLKLKEDRIGRRFENPVLCTVLLSAHLFDHSGDHTLDALVRRFGIDLPEDKRHTALGDALATAQVFQHMLGLLEGTGVGTLAEALDVSRKMTQIRRAQKY
ncbi:DNA polymerase-3 subunit epsilon [Rhodovulum imhoffii]|uniref:DNA-directed DNA polymerase n=1 Tax=Rhodovulum imhoffii TaxID=365340 RepID=A0A2T5BSX7_9RHOB|nr:exonuclease domain-containing protein [Rhodovulum imhoffii]MBK5933049.1 exonuclease [Rhodovulum imhoffii]PTN02363.1 DNA polymerase-3 subunit epsilon [Rhodovulum imhoffii]